MNAEAKHPLDVITDAIEHDTARYNDPPVESRARMTFKWAKIMQTILKMAPPERYPEDDNRTVSGEITAAR